MQNKLGRQHNPKQISRTPVHVDRKAKPNSSMGKSAKRGEVGANYMGKSAKRGEVGANNVELRTICDKILLVGGAEG